MKLLERILVATDFGPAAEDAVRMAAYAARHFESKVDLLHVQSTRKGAEVGSSSDLDQPTSDRLDAIAQQMVAQGVRHVESVLLDGAEFDEIDRYAEQQRVNVIVIGAGEMSGSQQVFLGTTAARLRRLASKPVWIVRPGATLPIRRILCPVDLLPASSRALKNAIHFARAFDAELTVLTVTQSPLSDSGDVLELREVFVDRPPESPEPHLPAFDKILANLDFHQVRCEKVIRQGKPQREVVRMAREIEADLIVMGSAGRSGLSRMLIGGVARRVAQEMPCSIITVRSQEPIQLTDCEAMPLDAEICASHPSGRECERFQYGMELLRQGLAEEAAMHFQTCVLEYSLCANAWGRLAEANARVGRPDEAQRCERNAKEALRRQVNQLIEEEARGGHVLHRRIFGM